MTVLRLREDVLILPYDEDDDSQRFVAGVDGRQFVISAGLAVLLDVMRSPATLELVAQRTSERTGVCITAAELEALLRERIPPMLFQADSDPQPLAGPLHFRVRWFSADLLVPILRQLHAMFAWRVVIGMLVALLCVEAVIAMQTPSVLPQEISSRDTALGIMLTLAGMALHELGHLAACHRFGVKHGGAGIGIYWCVPVIYAELHGAWMMPRMQRAAVHGAGVYVQCIYLTAVGALYLCFESPALLVAMAWSHLLVLHAINPLFKFDGYWLLADLAGVQDLHRKIGDVVRSACRGVHISRADLALAGVFAAGTCAYLSYLLNALAHGLASTASVISLTWEGNLGSVGSRGIALAICIAIVVVIAAIFARSLNSVFSERTP
jgi:putative peptide zinc metalloprotease protein